MKYQVYHIAFATSNLNRTLSFYKKLGLTASEVEEDPVDQFRYAVVKVDGIKLMLMEPTDPGGSVGRFLAKRGEGFHHLAFRTEDCRGAFEELCGQGVEFFGEEPREQSYEIAAFVKPDSSGGVLVEIVQPKP